jgi:hypothetical protein
MSFHYYHTLALIPQHVNISFDETAHAIKERFARDKVKVIVETALIRVKRNNWELRIWYEEKPEVLVESQEIASNFATKRDDATIIASCNRRFITSADRDPKMDYFNDYVFVLEALESINGIILFNPDDGTFI